MFGFDFYIVIGAIALGVLTVFTPGRALPPAGPPRPQRRRTQSHRDPGASIAWLRERRQLELEEPPRPTRPRILGYWKLTGRLWDGPPPKE